MTEHEVALAATVVVDFGGVVVAPVPVPVAPDWPPDLVVGTAVDPLDEPHAAATAMTEIATEMAIVAILARAGNGTRQPYGNPVDPF